MLEELISKKRLIRSYYYLAKLILVINIAEYLSSKGKDVCIFNIDKIKLEYYNFSLNFNLKCNERSENIIFEAEDESEVPINFLIVTSTKKLNLGIPTSEIFKVDQNLYRINIDENILLFRIVNGKIVEEKIKNVDEEIVNLLREYGELTLKEIVDIVSRKTNNSRDSIRKEIYFLKDIGIIEIKEGKVLLNNNSRL